MFRGFFKGLQERIEGSSGEHVDFVDDVDLVFGSCRKVVDFFDDPANIFNAVIGSCIHLDDIEEITTEDSFAYLALITGIAILGVEAIHSPGKYLCNGCFTGSPSPTKEIGMTDLRAENSLAEGLDDGILTYDIIKGLRSPLAIEGLISFLHYRHTPSLDLSAGIGS